MSRWLPACLAAGLLFAPPARAEEPTPPPKEPTPVVAEPPVPPVLPAPPPVAAPYAVPGCRSLSLPKLYLQELQCATTLPRYLLREEVVGSQCVGPVLDFVEQRQCVTTVEMKSHEVEQEVTCMTSQPCTTVDSCGKCCTVYQQVPVVKKVIVTVYEPVNVQKEVLVRVPVLKPGKDMLVQRIVADPITIPAIESRFQLLTVPNEVNVPEAVCPTPPCADGVCPVK